MRARTDLVRARTGGPLVGVPSPPTEPGALRAERVTVGYGERTVLDDLTFEVPRGALTVVTGPNGCGKSTLLRTLARTLAPRTGTVRLDGLPLPRWKAKALARRVALLPQHPVVPDQITVHGLVSRGRHPHHSPLRQWAPGDDEAVAAALRDTGTEDLQEELLATLSGGQRQRAWIAMVLAQQGEYVLLDEPTSFLDVSHQVDVLHLCQDVRSSGRSVVVVLHDLNQAARYADHLVVMHEGRLVAQGAPADVVTRERVEQVFSLPCQVVPDPQAGTPMVVPLRRGGPATDG